MSKDSVPLFDQFLPVHSYLAVHFNIGFKNLKGLSHQPLLRLLDSVAFNTLQYPFHTIHGPKEIHRRGPGLSHFLANLFNSFSKYPGIIRPVFLRPQGNPHRSRYSDRRRPPDGHGPNRLSHRRCTPAIQVPNLLGKPSLIENPYPITFPFNGFEFHLSYPE